MLVMLIGFAVWRMYNSRQRDRTMLEVPLTQAPYGNRDPPQKFKGSCGRVSNRVSAEVEADASYIPDVRHAVGDSSDQPPPVPMTTMPDTLGASSSRRSEVEATAANRSDVRDAIRNTGQQEQPPSSTVEYFREWPPSGVPKHVYVLASSASPSGDRWALGGRSYHLDPECRYPVSYTHLTLPTKRIV